MLLINLVADSY